MEWQKIINMFVDIIDESPSDCVISKLKHQMGKRGSDS
jgi:hypothetical protein